MKAEILYPVTAKTPKVEVVTTTSGRKLTSVPKKVRKAAKKAAVKDLKTPVWAKAQQDPAEQQHLAHRAANSRRRTPPTRGTAKRKAIDESR